MGTPSPRKAAVAGRFYPGRSDSLQRMVAELLPAVTPQSLLAVMAPHAGYPYSGATAGKVFAAVEVPDRVIVLSPNHTGMGERLAVWPDGEWELPIGRVPIDADLSDRIRASHPGYSADKLAHIGEHGIEVELPFLWARNPQFRLAAIVVAGIDGATAIELGQALATVILETPGDVLIVASTDMSHFIPATRAAELDRLALDQVEALDPMGLYRVCKAHHITMCGVLPTAIALAAANTLGARECRVVDYTHSGLVTGDHNSVVAYAGALIR